MSDSLITKYRPATFDEVIGQDPVVRSVKKTLEKGLSKTFMLSGPPGLGKTTLARLIATAAGVGPTNLLEIDGASKTGIDDMRSVTASLMYRPLGGGASKGIIIDEAQGLSKSAITSLLKILEEPPEWVYWFLCTTEPARIPEAIRTRSTHYSLKPVSFEELAGLLDRVVEAEGLKTSPEIVDLCAGEAGGSPRQALSHLSACAAAKDLKEAQGLLRAATASEEAVALARALINGASWGEVQKVLGGLGDTSPESIRHIVRAYVTKVVLGTKKEALAGRGLEILSAFSEPFHTADGLSPVVLACGQVTLSR